jgi:hypothetical protein
MNGALEQLRKACDVPRPAQFTDVNHCTECAEHHAALQRVTPDTIGLAELGSPGWDPTCFMSPEAFIYFLPGLARLALGTREAYFLDVLLFHLREERRVSVLSKPQRSALVAFLKTLPESVVAEASSNEDEAELRVIIQRLAA